MSQSVWKRETSALCYVMLDCLLIYVLCHCSISFDSFSDPHHFHLWLRVCGWSHVQWAGLESFKYCCLCPETDLAFNIFHVGTFFFPPIFQDFICTWEDHIFVFIHAQTCTLKARSCRGRWQKKRDVLWWAFPGGPVVKTLGFHCRGHRFDPSSGT